MGPWSGFPAGARPARVEGTFTGPELREDLFSLPPGRPVQLRPQWALPLNSAWPLDLYLRRHGGNGVSEVDVDWSFWFHYHAERGGTVVRSAEGLFRW